MSTAIEAVRGMRDVLHREHCKLTAIQTAIQSILSQYGYTSIDLPVLEHRDLYLRKMGEELVGKIYEFNYGGRDLSLRPEWTASVLRCYVAHLQDQPLPLRLSYSGPVFRYQRPQRLTYRQFTQTGVELVGGPAPRADAEVIALACVGLDAAEVPHYQVRLGHIGIVRELLKHLDLAERTQGLLMWSMERMRLHGRDAVRTHLYETMGDFPIDPSLLEGLNDDQIRGILLHMLQTMGVSLTSGTRSPEAIVDRLLRKMRRGDPQPRIEQALDVLWRLSQIRGAPDETLPLATALLNETGVSVTVLDELRSMLLLLEAHHIPPQRVILDFGLGRGLHYYTGMMFEIYDADEIQICGGGRYDDLVQTLGGGQAVPAVGFAYGMERVAAASQRSEEPGNHDADVLVAPVEDADYPYALDVARRLRNEQFNVQVDVRGRNVSGNLRDASRRGISYIAIVGSDERASQTVVWRNLGTREEQRIKLDNLDEVSNRLRNEP